MGVIFGAGKLNIFFFSTKMDNFNSSLSELITCKNKECQRQFGYIIKHLSQSPECKNAYTEDEYTNLVKESKAITNQCMNSDFILLSHTTSFMLCNCVLQTIFSD